MALATGFITISDLFDGTSGYQFLLSNENQTFPAGTDGAITPGNLGTFTCTILGYKGTTLLNYVNSVAPGVGSWAITNGTSSGTAAISATPNTPVNAGLLFTTTVVAGGVAITFTDNTGVSNGFADGGSGIDSAIITVPIRFDNGTTQTTKIITISKAKGGSAPYIFLGSNTFALPYTAGSPTVPRFVSLVTSSQSFSGSTVLNFASTTGVNVGMYLYGYAAIPAFTYVTAVGATTVTLSVAITQNIAASTTLVFKNAPIQFIATSPNITDGSQCMWEYSTNLGITYTSFGAAVTVATNGGTSVTLTGAPAGYTVAVGDVFQGPGVPINTTITAVGSGGAALTISNSVGTLLTVANNYGISKPSIATITSNANPTISNIATITPDQFQVISGAVLQATFRVTRAGSNDIVTVTKLFDGAGAPRVQIVSSNSPVFRNNVGTTVLTTTLTIGGILQTTGIIGYQWYKDNTLIAGQTSATLTVSAADIADNGSSQYACAVTY